MRRLLILLLDLLSPGRDSFEGVLGDLEEEVRRERDAGRPARTLELRALCSAILHQAAERVRRFASASPGVAVGAARFVIGVSSDARPALRRCLRAPASLIAGVVVLAIGVGANAAVFTAVEAILIRPLAFDRPEELVELRISGPHFRVPFKPSELVGLRESLVSADGVAAYRSPIDALIDVDGRSRLHALAAVSGDLFELLGVAPSLGRSIQPADSEPGAPAVVVVSQSFWQDQLGSDPSAVGRHLDLDDGRYSIGRYEIVGVMPDGFAFPDRTTDLWVAVEVDPGAETFDDRSENLRVLVRRADGAALATLAAEATAVIPGARSDSSSEDSWRVVATPLREELFEDFVSALGVMIAASLLVLLVAVVSLSGLVLVRERRRAQATRLRRALGASRVRAHAPGLVDAAVIAALGGVAGVALARLTLPAMLAGLPPGLETLVAVDVDLRALGFAWLLAVTAMVAAVLVALVRSWRVEARAGVRVAAISSQSSRATGSSGRGLVTAQVAITIPLAAAATILLNTVGRLSSVDSGVDSDQVWTLQLDARSSSQEALNATFESLLDRVRSEPPVHSASVVRSMPFSGGASQTNVDLSTADSADQDRGNPRGALVDYQVVHSGFFGTFGVPLLEGRDFAPSDRSDAPRVAIVNRRLAERYFRGQSALGREITLHGESTTIVGVVGDVRRRALREPPRPELYAPYGQIFNARGTRVLAVRVRSGEALDLAQLEAMVARIESSLAISRVSRLDDVLQSSISRERGLARLLSMLAVVAIGLTGAGAFSLLSLVASERSREVAVRRALGAGHTDVLRLILRELVTMLGIGVLLGVPVALALNRGLGSLLFEISPFDPTPLLLASLVAVSCGVGAAFLPALRVLRLDPVVWLQGVSE